MTRRRWTEAEEELLERLYGTVPTEEIARRLNRTVPSVFAHAGKMRLGRRMPAGSFTLNELLDVLGNQDHRAVRLWIERGLLRGGRLPYYGRPERPVFCVLADELIAFLREHPHLVDRDRVDAAYRQYVAERWITLPEAFRRGAAYPDLLEGAIKAGLLPEARQRGGKGTWWVIPERLLPELVAARRRMTTDVDHRRLWQAYSRRQAAGKIARSKSHLLSKARRAAAGGRSGRPVAA